jgi:hypothetical protein
MARSLTNGGIIYAKENAMPAWWILFIVNHWFGGDALYHVPPQALGALHHAVHVAAGIYC